jgi:hypothetical protein
LESSIKREPAKLPTKKDKRDAWLDVYCDGDEVGEDVEDDPETLRDEEERRPGRALPTFGPDPWPWDTPMCPGYAGGKHKCTACTVDKTYCNSSPCSFELRNRRCYHCENKSPEEYSDELP